MGGNAKYRYHTAVIRNPNTESGFQAMRDANGDLVRIPESERVVGKTKRTGANRTNARERMLNAQALKQVRDLAKDIRKFERKYPPGSIQNGEQFKRWQHDFDEADNKLRQLEAIANQVQQGAVRQSGTYSEILQDVEKVLGLKLH